MKLFFLKKFSEQKELISSLKVGNAFKNKFLKAKDKTEKIDELCKKVFINLSEIVKNSECSYAQNYLGYSYWNGIGIEKDLEKAIKFYTKAAEQGSVFALNNLGYSYLNGIGVEKDLEKAIKFYTKAAEQGNASALNNLGYS